MQFSKSSLASFGLMTTFVLLWGSAAIFTRWGLDHGSAFALLICRFGLALGALLVLGISARRWLPEPGTRLAVATTGLLLIGCYAICYFEAMAFGITPGLIATIMGIQPLLTLCLVERRFSPLRLAGLILALGGLVLVVLQSLLVARFSLWGMLLALGALGCMTFGAILQKRNAQPPSQQLPLQYGVSLIACLVLLPLQPFHAELSAGFIVPVLWLGLGISVLAQLLLYRMLRSGNIVNVTSLFYLVPAVTAAMDYLFLGNVLPWSSVIGMASILGGVALVFRHP